MVAIKWIIIVILLPIILGSCAPREVVLPAPEILPSRVVTSDGMRFEVNNLRIAGTEQDFKLKTAGTTTWIPLSDVANIRMTGPLGDQYRPARIFLLRGGRLEGELYVGLIIEGKSDQGYWNMPMEKVEAIDLGSD